MRMTRSSPTARAWMRASARDSAAGRCTARRMRAARSCGFSARAGRGTRARRLGATTRAARRCRRCPAGRGRGCRRPPARRSPPWWAWPARAPRTRTRRARCSRTRGACRSSRERGPATSLGCWTAPPLPSSSRWPGWIARDASGPYPARGVAARSRRGACTPRRVCMP